MIVSKVDVCMTMGSLQIQREQVELKNQKTARPGIQIVLV